MKILAQNKRGGFDYQISEKMVAGLVLSGAEVKSAKLGHVSLQGSYIGKRGQELYLVNAHFTPYHAAASSPEPTRSRKLLMHRKQINQILGSPELKAIPLNLHLQRGLVKLEIGLGKGRKKVDKRELIKKRDQLREARRGA